MSKITLTFMQRFMGNLDTAIRTFVGGITGDKADLQTTNKDSLVDAINEVAQGGGGGGSTTLGGLTDVTLTNPSSDQVLKYDGEKWVNGSGGSGSSTLADLTDVSLNTPTTGQLLQFNGTAWVNVDNNVSFKSQTLAANATSVTFTGIPTTGNYITDIFTSKAGLDYESINDSTAGTLVVTYEAQSSAVTVYLRLEKVG